MHSLGGIEFTVTMLQPAVASCGNPFSASLTVAGHGQQTKTEISPEESGEKSDTGMEWYWNGMGHTAPINKFSVETFCDTTTQIV